ncbi:MAG: hypothetical protein WC752_01380 [Patescibacteria group bacterium]|jgi:Tol biopolymer transport system component
MKKVFTTTLAVLLFFVLASPAVLFAENRIYYATTDAGEYYTSYPIYQMKINGTGKSIVTVGGNQLDSSEGISVSPNGEKIAYACASGTFMVCMINSDGTDSMVVDENSVTINHQVSWSPNGNKIIYSAQDYTTGSLLSYIYTANKNGKNVSDMTPAYFNLPISGYASYSPDNSKIVFEGEDSLGNHNIYIMDANSTNPVSLTTNNKSYEPRFSPNSKRIVFVKKVKSNYRLFTMKKNGNDVKRLKKLKGEARTPAYTPNGKKIIFSFKKSTDSDFEIYSLRLKDKKLKRLTNNSVDDLSPSVGPVLQ